MDDPYVALAKEFKKRNNPSVQGITTGTVTIAPPELTVVVNGIIASKEYKNIVVSDFLLGGYNREVEIDGTGKIITKTPPPPPITYDSCTEMESFNLEGNVTLTDTLKVGDSVIVIPSIDNGIYYVVGKVGVL